MSQKTLLKLEQSLKKLQSTWPQPFSKETQHLFIQAQKCLEDLQKPQKTKSKKDHFFDFLETLHQVLKTHDLLFLSRHLIYHVVTTADLAKAFGSKEEATAILTELVVASAKRAHFDSKLEIQIKEVRLREGPAIQARFIYAVDSLDEAERQKILEHFFQGTGDGEETSDLAFCRQALRRAGGQLWLEFPKSTHVAFTFHWPAFDTSSSKLEKNYGTYKYDITLADFTKIRQRFGIVRAKKLVQLVEGFVKGLVRHPVDMVMAFPAQGVVTAIYESQEGAASSVSTRISQRLKKETFRLGSKNVTPHFRYQLSFLA
ncbi:MAG: hypothetical protein A3H42_02650 [Deltaproteobacteria bacterium RIFCSPLOWO2_02_FULL_46_8]|nr:MAG: hypothetical protein A3H42_02650 [Deltaproteobacteria bacterium RIFCSPLOWO2_02_FULL_46_8]